ncbi:hypothetical protein [Nonomuraea soli]|uniref:Protein kinase domain-containing protein n=1 Tax=Nonomuraea soli TaxID=1032476 RepID=A0A7W0CMD8_9ACTN|nr:hypothetical protein [Nonomuraea soli]MBA2893642.1 hypothetical protein [Nonomuraea soli]
MNARSGIAGFQLTERTRVTELGTWVDAVGPDGHRGGALRFDPAVMGLPGVRDRVVATVLADRQLAQAGIGGLVPVDDVVAAGEEVWLLTRQPTTPSLADLISRHGLDPASAAAVLVETAQILLGLHASGLAHGSVHPGTVVIAADGGTLLSERGLADAVRGQYPSPQRDVTAWASLARGLAAMWGGSHPRATELFERAAATATTRGLAAARDALLAGRDALGQITRDRLSEAARTWSAPPVAPMGRAGVQDEGEIVTLLHVPGAAQQFGPGVPTEHAEQRSTVEQIWQDGRNRQPPPRKKKRPVRTIVAAVLFAVIVGGAILVWTMGGKLVGSSTPIAVSKVDVIVPKKAQRCTEPVKVQGKLSTNGKAGTVVYEWEQSDSGQRIRKTQAISEGATSWTVTLLWTIDGSGKGKLTATLRIISPVPEGKRVEDKATFSFNC